MGLEGEGEILFFDSTELMNYVELEALLSEEILQVKSKLRKFTAYI